MIAWKYSKNSDLSSHEDLNATYSSTETGLSWLDVDNTKQGYYQCQISSSSYTVGVYDTSVTTGNFCIVINSIVVYYLDIVLVAVPGSIYTYLEGIDRENILLLCDPMDSGIFSTLMWNDTYPNPLNIHSVWTDFPTEFSVFTCSRGASSIVSIFLSVSGMLQYLLHL